MDFQPTAKMERIRSEIRESLAAALPDDWQGSGFLPMDVRPEHMELARSLDRRLAAKRLLAPAWPEEFGGRGLSPFEQFALYEELGMALAPRLTTISVDLVGPVLILHGSDEQRRQHLPAIASEAAVWCQGFSEPSAGSDLTSLKTRAERKGDVYLVTGHKLWTSMAHISEWMILLARTGAEDSRGRGLSLFLLPTNSPGVTIRPIYDATNEHMLNEVFFEDVQIPVEQRIGEENKGWTYATSLLQYERGDALFTGQFRRLLDDLMRLARSNGFARSAAAAASALAEHEIDWQIGRLLTLRVVGLHAAGKLPDRESSQAKLFMSEAYQRLGVTAQRLAGQHGHLTHQDARTALGGRIVQALLSSTTATIIAGTSEIQRTIIATRGLGLPRG
ncbi:MAG: acyl-CoA dehydrogenase family protein [Planctomycetes bacterium]|nr:acyl-CoA dehydrogenase family protein [Planctomycetota bacterium]